MSQVTVEHPLRETFHSQQMLALYRAVHQLHDFWRGPDTALVVMRLAHGRVGGSSTRFPSDLAPRKRPRPWGRGLLRREGDSNPRDP